MLSYLFIGANDVNLSGQFYDAVLLPLGYEKDVEGEKLIFSLPDMPDRHNGPGAIFISQPYNGGKAEPANGMMPGFRVKSRKLVDEIHAAGLTAGGSDEGAPGLRDRYGDHFYVAYLRDPAGNKLAMFCNAE
ncbi:MAG: VOC family protein [Enterobacterales bacterium endosymbiont of Blomia tropicalis]|uniref:VOC family protein n=1 Tax=Mixta mediterraneensis TaxID=2758443 RepID=UPI0025A86C2E|nr:VOC family protein [Mixta mediterraneensis]MDL4915984.1 VOC family protein [Mixta mediterraneensis]